MTILTTRGALAFLTLGMILGSAGCSKSVEVTAAADSGRSPRQDLLTSKDAATCPGAIGDTTLAGKPALTVSHGQVATATAGTISYSVNAGYLPIYAQGTQTGSVRACMFFFGYSADTKDSVARPVTFLFNGGPGSPSDWLHLGGLGPKTMDFGPEGLAATSPHLTDDQYTLLATTDLVFIDPINTGYSRPATGVDPTEFDGLNQDADSIGDFIQGYLTAFNRTTSPKYLVGESYAGMRIPVLSRYLDEKLGIKLQGVTFISPWLDAIGDSVFGDRDVADDLPYVGYLPEYATVAWYHQKLGQDLEAKDLETIFTEAETLANGEYLEALAAGDEISPTARAQVLADLSRYTGINESVFTANNLRLSLDDFRSELLKSTGEVFAFYDGRLKGVESDPTQGDPFDSFDELFKQASTDYFANTLGVTTDLPYQGNDWKSWPGANPTGGIQGGYLNVLDDINTLATNNPALRIYIASGLFDLVCPAAEVHYMIRHLKPEVAARIQIGHYPAGHPIYFSGIAHEKFAQEMATFIH